MKNREFVIEQHRRGKLVRSFTPTGDDSRPWRMDVNGKRYMRSHGWVLSKILPTLTESSIITTIAIANNASTGQGASSGEQPG